MRIQATTYFQMVPMARTPTMVYLRTKSDAAGVNIWVVLGDQPLDAIVSRRRKEGPDPSAKELLRRQTGCRTRQRMALICSSARLCRNTAGRMDHVRNFDLSLVQSLPFLTAEALTPTRTRFSGPVLSKNPCNLTGLSEDTGRNPNTSPENRDRGGD